MSLRLIIGCLLVMFYQSYSRSADTNLTADADARDIFIDTGISTKLLATGEWSKPVSDGQATKISERLLVYDGAYFTNEFGKPSWFAAPVFFEIHNETGLLTEIYFDWKNDIHFELHDVNGKSADNLKQHGGGSYTPMRSYWVSVTAGGLLRVRANQNIAYTELVRTEQPNPGGLSLFCPGGSWLIPAGDTNAYFLSATLSSQPTNSSPDSHAVWRGKLEFPAVKLGSSVLK